MNSTEESKGYSETAIKAVTDHKEGYLGNTDKGNEGMLIAAFIAGRAINITQTTAGHAMCYKITSLYGFAHGHAAALCVRTLYPWMIKHTNQCSDLRGKDYLMRTLDEIGRAMGCKDADGGARKLYELFESLELDVPTVSDLQYEELRNSVNPVRLRNHPIALDLDIIDALYHEILR